MKLLAFLSRRLGLLKRIPLLTQLLEALLTTLTAITRPSVQRRVERLCAEARKLDGVAERVHRYGGIQFDLEGRELGHVHGNGIADLRFRRGVRDELVSAGRALPHHTLPNSGWVTIILNSDAELYTAIELLGLRWAEASTRLRPTGGSQSAPKMPQPVAARSLVPIRADPGHGRRG